MGVVTMSTTFALSYSTTKAELEEWLGTLADDARFRVNTTPGDRNESASHSITATWSSIATKKA